MSALAAATWPSCRRARHWQHLYWAYNPDVSSAWVRSVSASKGFDPLRLGTNPETLKWYREAELYNGRWAMAAVAGILFTDLVGLPKFWLAGAEVRQPCSPGRSGKVAGQHIAAHEQAMWQQQLSSSTSSGARLYRNSTRSQQLPRLAAWEAMRMQGARPTSSWQQTCSRLPAMPGTWQTRCYSLLQRTQMQRPTSSFNTCSGCRAIPVLPATSACHPGQTRCSRMFITSMAAPQDQQDSLAPEDRRTCSGSLTCCSTCWRPVRAA